MNIGFLSIINNKISRVMIGQELSSCCLSILYNKVYQNKNAFEI